MRVCIGYTCKKLDSERKQRLRAVTKGKKVKGGYERVKHICIKREAVNHLIKSVTYLSSHAGSPLTVDNILIPTLPQFSHL